MKRSTVVGMVLLGSVAFGTAVVAQSADTPAKQVGAKQVGAEQAGADLSPGEGWSEVPTRPESGVTARAWSDLAAGCHLAQFALPATEKIGIAPLRSAFNLVLAKSNIAISEDIRGGLRLTGPDITGLVRLALIEGKARSASLLACYWNQREPARCQAICKRVLQAQADTSQADTSQADTSQADTSPADTSQTKTSP